ncbi:MAG: hypothetical protein H7Y20_13935 [Bryobacteraceae bacterium]|nr:hypothetical protein [Bryobacteraceae bacterium]
MRLSQREQRLLIILPVVAGLILTYWWTTRDDETKLVVAAVESIPTAQRRLESVQRLASLVPGKQQILKQVSTELAARERNLIQADTAPQAQAQLLQILRTIAKGLPSPIDLRNTEIGQVKAFGDHYGEVSVSVNFESGIEQLVNLLSDLTARKELIGTTELHVGAANPKQKTMPVRLTITGLVRRDLVPDKKGSAF